ncbi:tRNA(Ile)-lysidine synthase [invertebrate metagenome]|uniref:tRNA(Ile)-lysidine synthetase n=1 Tax=invertebrate metagenome TaxID=1711999 RepID=A0A2H9T7Q3_9ZZZZ
MSECSPKAFSSKAGYHPLVNRVSEFLTPWNNYSMVVAFSGGLDSTVLLDISRQLRDSGIIHSVRAVHVHHGLSSHADQWAEHCRSLCGKWDIPICIERVDISNACQDGVEQAARDARYAVFEQQLDNNDCLLLAHHGNDQAETLLFRLFRGAGINGLAGIPKCRTIKNTVLLRPMLSSSRQEISDYAVSKELFYVEDESNSDETYTRNYLRHTLLPMLEGQWPGVTGRLSLLAQELSDVNEQLDIAIQSHLKSLICCKPQWMLGEKPLLNGQALMSFSLPVARQVVRAWLKSQHFSMPDRVVLEHLFSEVVQARVDASPVIKWQGCEVRRFRSLLIASRPQKLQQHSSYPIQWDWKNQSCIRLPDGKILQVRHGGYSERHSFLLPEGRITIYFRDDIPADRLFAVAGRNGRKTLKRWLQTYQIPPWLRNIVPVLFFGDKMMGVPGLWVCPEFYGKGGKTLLLS